MTLAISILVRPFVVNPDVPKAQSTRQFAAVDELAQAIGAAAGISVEVIEGKLSAIPATGYVLVFSPIDLDELAKLPDSVTRRIVLVRADGATVRRVLEDQHLAAAIVMARYFDWQTHRDREVGRGVIGRKDLAGAIHATCVGTYATQHYDTPASPVYGSLPALLVGYLQAHASAS